MITLSEMARRVNLGRARFYQLVEQGIFPSPKYNSKKRPYYDKQIEAQCKHVRDTGIGVNGEGVLFYNNTKSQTSSKRAMGLARPCPWCGGERPHANLKYCSEDCKTESKEQRDRESLSVSLDDVLEQGIERPAHITIKCKRCGKRSEHKYRFNSGDKKWYVERPCSECKRVHRKEHYRQNPELYHKRYMEGRHSKRAHLRKLALAYLGGKCLQCGIEEPLDFHHRDPSEKAFNISEYFNKCSYGSRSPSLLDHPSLLKELDKCDLLCANHHRNVTLQINKSKYPSKLPRSCPRQGD